MKKIIKIQKKEENNTLKENKLNQNFKRYDTNQSDQFTLQNELINDSFESDLEMKEFSQMFLKYDKKPQQKQQVQLKSQPQKTYQEQNEDQLKQLQKQKAPKIKPFHLQPKAQNKLIQSEQKQHSNSKYSDSLDSDEDQILKKYFKAQQNENFQQIINDDDFSDQNYQDYRKTRGNSQITNCNPSNRNSNYLEHEIRTKSQIYEKKNGFNYLEEAKPKSQVFEKNNCYNYLENQAKPKSQVYESNAKLNEKRIFSQIQYKKQNLEDDLLNSDLETKQYESQFDQDLSSNNFKQTKKLVLKKSIIQQQQCSTSSPVKQNKLQLPQPEIQVKAKTLSNQACSPIKVDSFNKLFEENQHEEIQGSFEKGYQALSMQMHDYDNDQYLVEWKNIQSKQIDSIRIKPKSSVYKLCEIKKFAPEIYLSFLENQFGDFQKYKLEKSQQEKELIQKKQFQDSNSYVIKVNRETEDNNKNGEAGKAKPTVALILQNLENKETKSQLSSQQQLEEITPSCFQCDEKLNSKQQNEQDEFVFENQQEQVKQVSEQKPQEEEQEYKPEDDYQDKSYSQILKEQVQELPQDISFEEQQSLQIQQSTDIVQPVDNQKDDVQIVEEVNQEDKTNTEIEQESSETAQHSKNQEQILQKENQVDPNNQDSLLQNEQKNSNCISLEDDEPVDKKENNQVQQQVVSENPVIEEMQIEELNEKENELFETENNQKKKNISIEKTSSTEKMMEKLTVNTDEALQPPEKKQNQQNEQDIEVKEKKVIQIDLDTYQDDEEEENDDDEIQEIADKMNSHISQIKFQNIKDDKISEVEELKCKEGDDLFEPIVTDHRHLHEHQHQHAKEIFENHSTKSKLEVIPEVGNDSESDQSCQNKLLNSSMRSFEKHANGKKNQSVEMIEDDVVEYTQHVQTAPLIYPIQSRSLKLQLNQPRVVAARKSTGIQVKQTNFNDSSEEESNYEIEENFCQQEGSSSLLSGSLGRFKSRVEKLL